MRRPSLCWSLAVVGCLASSACGLDLEGLSPSDGGNSTDAPLGTNADATTHDTGGPVFDGGQDELEVSDSASPPDAGTTDGAASDGADACSAVEICDNGIDDNCDGKIDCADPECNTWGCVGGPIPAGWSLLELSVGANPAPCNSNFANPTTVYSGTYPPAACSCTAKLTPGSCTSGNIDVSTGTGGCSMTDAGAPAGNGVCGPLPGAGFTPPPGFQMDVVPAPYTPGTCMPTPTTTITPVAGYGQTCAFTQAAGGGCAAGNVCVPQVSGNYHHCIVTPGSATCPAGLGYTSSPSFAFAYDDTRGCTACTATGPTATCANAELSFYTDTACTQGAANIPATSTCTAFPPQPQQGLYKASRYTAAVQNETCSASPVTPTGGVALPQASTVCCR